MICGDTPPMGGYMAGLMNGLMSTQNPFLKLDANTNADVKCEQYLKMVKNQQMSNSFYRPQRSCGKVMFLHLCVIVFTGGLCPGGSLSGGSLWGFSVQGGLCLWGSLSGRPLLYGNVRAVRILLECILVINSNLIKTEILNIQ